MTPDEVQEWFQKHVAVTGEPYSLDIDQARAVSDDHRNCLVTARAGSGKTRVIVAKVAYLAAHGVNLNDILVFMFNRAAAEEVNARLANIKVDNKPLPGANTVKVSSTFHKFALDIVKLTGKDFSIVSEAEHGQLIRQCFDKIIDLNRQRVAPRLYSDYLKLTQSFIARAGQKFTGETGFEELRCKLDEYCQDHLGEPKAAASILIHKLSFATYELYRESLKPPKIDFNTMMTRATEILQKPEELPQASRKLAGVKYIMVDEYQDFSYLFYALILALRSIAVEAKLFAVGDDWQAINRFAGSDVDYFINFQKYFPEDFCNIPLLTNYRSDNKIVENANEYMLKFYDPAAKPAVARSKKPGKILRVNPERLKYDASDTKEDGLGDGRYQKAILAAMREVAGKGPRGTLEQQLTAKPVVSAAKYLKMVVKIAAKHHGESIMLLHRHNFLSFQDVTLPVFKEALFRILVDENYYTAAEAKKYIRLMTMHKSKGLEADVVILLEFNHDQVLGQHPYAAMFTVFDDSREVEQADQHRLIYVALTRAKHRLYLLTIDEKAIA